MGYRLKFGPRPGFKIKGQLGVSFPIVGRNGIAFERTNNIWYGELDYSDFVELAAYDPTQKFVAVYDRAAETWNVVTLAGLLTNTSVVREVTEAGDVTVTANTRLLLMNRTADESPSNIIMPAASTKVGPIKIVDMKGNAGSFPHTISLDGAEEFQGGITEWTIGGDGASVVLDPIPGTGYAV